MEIIYGTKYEIEMVRAEDRKTQGVTEYDENLAEQSMTENKIIVSGFKVIRSLTERLSTITDLMYGKADNLTIYTDNELFFTEKEKSRL